MFLSQALCEFTEWGNSKYAPRTVLTYTDLVRRFIEFHGDAPVRGVSITDITKYFKYLRERKYADSSIAYMMIALRQYFKYLFLRRIVMWDYQIIGVPKYSAHSYIPIEHADAMEMIGKIIVNDFRSLRDKTILAFLYASGVRVAELCDLRIGDLRLDHQYGSIISKKNRQRRMIFWDHACAQLLKDYLTERARITQSDFLFISTGRQNMGMRLTTRTVQRLVARLRPNHSITPHSFRHGLGMRLVANRVHPRYIMCILGHKNVNSSQVYMDIHDPDVVHAYREGTRETQYAISKGT